MKINDGETVVAVGVTDGFRYVGITPPLTREEVRTMEWAGVLEPGIPLQQIEEFEPHCSLLTVAGENGMRTEAKTERAIEVASKIAYALGQAREGSAVRHDTTLVGLVGHNSSPFNPDTDSLRHS